MSIFCNSTVNLPLETDDVLQYKYIFSLIFCVNVDNLLAMSVFIVPVLPLAVLRSMVRVLPLVGSKPR